MMSISEVAQRFLALEPGRHAGGVQVFAVDGRSGSGKSTIGGWLAEAVEGTLVHFDDFLPGWDAMEPGPELAVEWVLDPLAAGRDGRYRLMDWPTLQYQGEKLVPWTNRLVIEGVGASSALLRPYLAASIWVEAPLDVCSFRVEKRWDWDTYAPYRAQCITHESEYIERERPVDHARIVVDGTVEVPQMLAITEDRIAR
jgi:hypothetical protein